MSTLRALQPVKKGGKNVSSKRNGKGKEKDKGREVVFPPARWAEEEAEVNPLCSPEHRAALFALEAGPETDAAVKKWDQHHRLRIVAGVCAFVAAAVELVSC